MDDEKQLQLFDGPERAAAGSQGEGPVSWHLDHQPVPEPASRRTLWPETDRRDDLADLAAVAEAARDCRRCKLGGMRKNAVPGEGNPNARIMWIGEGPGADEDEQGRPFVGAAGRMLDRLITAMGLVREEMFIGNVVKCRPPHNREPEPDEVRACLPYLARQIELIRPEIIVILGATALKALIDPRAYITRMHGKWIERGGIMIMPTFHPAALLRDPARKRDVWADMQQVLARMR